MDKATIKAERERRNWTQRDLARKCKVSVRTVQGWEQGRRIGGLARCVLAIKFSEPIKGKA